MLILFSLFFVTPGWSMTRAEDCSLEFPTQKVCAAIDWVDGPVVSDPSLLRVHFYDPSTHQPVDVPGAVHLDIGMLHMCHEHEKPDAVHQPPQGSGIYESQFVLFMAGEWQIQVSIDVPGRLQPETQIYSFTLH